jgi:hypothetical protein
MQFDTYVHATLPHEYTSPASTSHAQKSADQLSDGCRYKGWTLVDCGRWMYAVRDTLGYLYDSPDTSTAIDDSGAR